MPHITEMYCFVTFDAGPDDEGVPAFLSDGIAMPMMGADLTRVEDLMPIAQQLANDLGKEIRIYKFSQREQIGIITPVPRKP